MAMAGIIRVLILLLISVKLFAAPGDTLDVVKYNLNLTVTNFTSKVIYGNAGIDFCVKQPAVQQITLELRQLQVDSVKSADGTSLAFSRQGDYLRVTLPTVMNPADTANISIWYHGVPYYEGWGGFYFSGQYAFNLGVGFESIPHNLGKAWFPCVDDFQDRALYEYHVTVESSKKAVCGGLLQSVTEHNNGTHTFYWKTFKSIPTYLASLAIGPYAYKSDTFNSIAGPVPITWYLRPGDTSKIAGTFANLKTIAANFEERFGAYPFNRIGFTGTGLGAMEHAENIFLPNGTITGNASDEWLYSHELSHMWFGDKVTCATDADMWLNEGIARWCEIMFTEDLYGTAAADEYYRALHKGVLLNTHLTDDGYRALSPMDPEYTYGSTVYDKGAVVTHALRYFMGDSLFFQGVRDYLTQYAFNDADSYQFRDALSASSGIDLTGFFDFYVFTPGFTHYSIDSFLVGQKCGQYQAEIYMKQKLRGTTVYDNDCRADITFVSPDFSMLTTQVSFSGVRDTVLVTLAFNPALILVDLFNHASDATTDQYKIIKATGLNDFEHTYCKVDVKQVTDSAFLRVTHNWVAPDSLLTPQPGLTLSTVRYWTVEGIFPQGFTATGIFNYNRNIFDSDILTSSSDSLVMLYRESAGHEWRGVPFTRTGPWQIGYIYVDNLQPGQYALAVWDEEYVGYNSLPVNKRVLHIFPNPSKGSVTIGTSLKGTAELVIHKADGRKVFSHMMAAGEEVQWSDAPGTYLVSVYENKRKVASAKAVIQ